MKPETATPSPREQSTRRYPLLLTILTALWWLMVFAAPLHESDYPQYLGRYSQLYLTLMLILAALGLALSALWWYCVRHGVPRFLVDLRSLFLLTCFTVVFGLLTVEVLIRAFDLLGASFYREISHYIMDLEEDEYTVYRHAADFQSHYQGVAFATNELGLRDGPVLQKQDDEFRILAIGDSVTTGWGVEQQDVFVTLLEKSLGKRLNRPVRIINSGVCGYNTVQELAYLLNYGLALNPDALLLTYVDNDVDPEPLDIEQARRQWHEPEGASALLTRYSWMYRIYFHILPYLLNVRQLEVDPLQFRSSETALAGIARAARERELPLLVSFFRLNHSERGDALARMLAAGAAENDYRYLDLLPVFADRDIRKLTNSIIDIHPNAEGHRLMADYMADPLVETFTLEAEPQR